MNRILAVSPHPDDVEFGIGALLIKERKQGSRIRILVCSRGEAGTHGTPSEREHEARSAAEKIGAEVSFMDMGGDCHIQETHGHAFSLAREIRAFQPQIVLAPHREQNQHPDHSRVGRMVMDAARYARYGELAELSDLRPHAIGVLYWYAVTLSVSALPDILIDISEEKEEWEAVMEAHASQLQTRPYRDLQIARARTWGLMAGTEYAIGVWKNDPLIADALSSISRSARVF